MNYPKWLGKLNQRQEHQRKAVGVYPAPDGWYKTLKGKKKYIAKPMPLADVLRHEGDLVALRGLAEQEHSLSGFDWRAVLGRLYPGQPPERLSPLIGAIRSIPPRASAQYQPT